MEEKAAEKRGPGGITDPMLPAVIANQHQPHACGGHRII
jgi:hypothetical protein